MNNENGVEREVTASSEIDSASIGLIASAEINQQIATAKRFPRSIKKFRDEALQMATLNEEVAKECVYALPRDGKIIEGPSARFAEIVGSAWGNSHAGTRVVSDTGDFVTAQSAFWDLERNWKVVVEVQRRITNRSGQRYGADMIAVTANAASSVALRNAILKGVPKAFWNDIYQKARHVVLGDFKTLANRRATAFQEFVAFGATKEMVCQALGVAGEQDIGLEHLVALQGFLTALKEGDTTPELLFAAKSGKPTVAEPESKSETAEKAKNHAKASTKATVKPGGKKAQVEPDASKAAAATGGAAILTVSATVAKTLRQNLDSAKIEESEFCHVYDIKRVEDLPADKAKGALTWMLENRKE